MIEIFSMAFSGSFDPVANGRISQNGILHTKPVIEDLRSGRSVASLMKSSLFLLKIWNPAARSGWRNVSLTALSPVPKKGLSGGKNEAWQGNKDHGNR
jgi:hypothetical protein